MAVSPVTTSNEAGMNEVKKDRQLYFKTLYLVYITQDFHKNNYTVFAFMPLKFKILLQQAAEGLFQACNPFAFCDMIRRLFSYSAP